MQVRRRTVPVGIALGIVLLIALTLAGAIGIQPLPGWRPGTRDDASGSPLSGTQPEIGGGPQDRSKRPPGYRSAAGAPTGGAAEGSDTRPPGAPSPEPKAPQPAGPRLPPGLGFPAVPPFGEPDGPPAGPQIGAGNGWRPWAEPGQGWSRPGRPTGREESTGVARLRCGWLFIEPWTLITAGLRQVAEPSVTQHVDPERGVYARQVAGAFTPGDAERGLAQARRAAAGCRRFWVGATGPGGFAPREPLQDLRYEGWRGRARHGEPGGAAGRAFEREIAEFRSRRHDRHDWHDRHDRYPGAQRRHRGGHTAIMVTMRPEKPHPAHATAGCAAPDDTLAVRLKAVAEDGRTWTGYLEVDRTGPVLSLRWELGNAGTLGGPSAAEGAMARPACPLAGQER